MPVNHHVKIVAVILLLASIAGTAWVVFFDGAALLQRWIVSAASFAQLASGEHRFSMLLVYSAVCLITQLIVIPSGSMILIVSGFIFGPLVAAGIFSVAQILALWPVYKVAAVSMQSGDAGWLHRFQQSLLSNPAVLAIKKEGIAAGIVLRLTPVIPSAAASCIAAALNIPIKLFVIATVLVCWVRPLFFASVGGTLQEISSLKNTLSEGSSISIWPIIFVFISAVLLLVARLWLRWRQ